MRKTRDYLAVRRAWYERLRDQGFDDLEIPDGRGDLDGQLRNHGRLTDARLADYEALSLYYQQASAFLARHRFANAAERRIWELHAEGASYTRIARRLRGEGLRRMYRRRVAEVVPRLRGVMLGQVRSPRRRGRPANPDGRYRGCVLLAVKLSDAEALALDALAERWGVPGREVVRRAIVAMANKG